ncbi:Bro-N domain-containing protein [Mesorhizobium sp. M0179]|uniref:BRO-N domain-containing protein n=1 Tax=Mesorhizobium sp. M0179 TaxID=2956905 RepID=UPI00333D4F6F
MVTIDGNPWFVAADAITVLGHQSDTWKATRSLDENEKRLLRRSDTRQMGVRDDELFAYKQPSLALISESGLYKLVMRSDKPQAKPFQDWVTQVVSCRHPQGRGLHLRSGEAGAPKGSKSS